MVFILPLTPHYSIFEMSYLEDIEHIFLVKIRLYAWIFLYVSIIQRKYFYHFKSMTNSTLRIPIKVV